jgi:hypothetical protein
MRPSWLIVVKQVMWFAEYGGALKWYLGTAAGERRRSASLSTLNALGFMRYASVVF